MISFLGSQKGQNVEVARVKECWTRTLSKECLERNLMEIHKILTKLEYTVASQSLGSLHFQTSHKNKKVQEGAWDSCFLFVLHQLSFFSCFLIVFCLVNIEKATYKHCTKGFQTFLLLCGLGQEEFGTHVLLINVGWP